MATGNFGLFVRMKRWMKFLFNYINERLHGLDFSMVYVGMLQQNVKEFHGYSMTDAGEMKRMLQAVPIESSKAAFLDVGCGKGMCVKCAAEIGFMKVAGLDLDSHLLDIARNNMQKLRIQASFFCENAVDFSDYADYDVFYFYNPFGESIFKEVIQKLIVSQKERNRPIWVIYYHPVFGELFDNAGFIRMKEIHYKTRDTTARFYLYPEQQ